jgi:hypothetical protein
MTGGPTSLGAPLIPVNNALAKVRETIADALRPGHFFVKPPMELTWAQLPAEELVWEIFHGRLLDAAHTRSKQTFESWNIHWVTPEGRSVEPLLSLKLDWPARRLYVTRGILSYVWEPYDAGGNVILSREVRKWVRELVAVVDLPEPVAVEHLQRTLAHRLFQAVVGVSRLPLTSVEAPLPNFTIGHLAHFHSAATEDGGGAAEVLRSYRGLLSRALSTKRPWSEKVKLLEVLLRSSSADQLADGAVEFVRRWHEIGHTPEDIPKLVLTMFDEVALSPYTDFADKTIRFLALLEEQGALGSEQHADLLSSLLRRIGRHLTAFDLVTFHHRGANYPDALLLDALLKAYLALADRRSDLFLITNKDTPAESQAKRLRRRGLRQGWLLRRLYEGHPVPDTPTSPGENARVLPPEFPHVAEEQILNPHQRTRLLFARKPQLSPTGEQVLKQSVADLEHPAELQELGTALFLDRPLGVFKHPAEPDQTILLSYEAFSRSLAARRLDAFAGKLGLLSPVQKTSLVARLKALTVPGVPIERSGVPPRPGVPSLQDAWRVAEDFVLVRSTKRAVSDFLAQYDVSPVRARFQVEWLRSEEPLLIAGSGSVAGTGPGTLKLFDSSLQPGLELEMEARSGYASGLRGEFPVRGLRLVRIWERSDKGQGGERELSHEEIWLASRE